ncbi:DUF4190 domain-containing protein [Actinoplanes sp. KI2]|uniref:DUF4190 domain-containing protein n=1 Tax=Actinoplanes sp. KI2 TaxID=2983315 RepID=UPI0021D5B567|nr:DUF4190 domain-containing protein [Actinoplanes sp. KI2]MCU7730892.1 DUF4190 domain-containing protein [Actinoplanes sp. KI2]
MTYPPTGGPPDPYQPQQPYGQPYDPNAPYPTDPPAPTSDQPYGQPPASAQPYGQPTTGQPYGQPSPYQQPPPSYAYGAPGYGAPGYAPVTSTNTLAILALVFAFVFSPAAIVLGHLAKKQIRQTGEQGEGLATAGLWLGYIFTILGLLACAVYVIVIVIAVGNAATNSGGTF